MLSFHDMTGSAFVGSFEWYLSSNVQQHPTAMVEENDKVLSGNALT